MPPSSDPLAPGGPAGARIHGVGRSWPGLAAIGAGLIHFGVAASSDPIVLVVLVLVGAAETGWGVVALSRTSPPALRTAFATAVLLVAGWVATLLLPGGAHEHAGGASAAAAPATALPVGALAGAGLLDLAVAVALASAVRRRGRRTEEEPAPLWALLGTAAGAGVVAIITATSLAGVTAGASHLH